MELRVTPTMLQGSALRTVRTIFAESVGSAHNSALFTHQSRNTLPSCDRAFMSSFCCWLIDEDQNQEVLSIGRSSKSSASRVVSLCMSLYHLTS